MRWLRAISIELFALAYCFLVRLLPAKWACRPTPRLDGRPILLVHGYLNNAWVWLFLKKQLVKARLGPIYCINLKPPFSSLSAYGSQVALKAKEIARETRREDLILIGYSMGGLVSACYAATFAPVNTVTDCILIASPIEGTPIAKIAIGANAKEMRPESLFLQKLRGSLPKDVRFYQIAALCDQLVIPGISAGRFVPLERRFILQDLSHAGVLLSPRVAQQIIDWLSRDYRMEALSPSTVI